MPKHGSNSIEENILPEQVDYLLLRRKFLILDFLEVQSKLAKYATNLGIAPEDAAINNSDAQIKDPDGIYLSTKKALEDAEIERRHKDSGKSTQELLDKMASTIVF